MIHLNIGSNLNSIYGSRFDNISIAIHLLIEAKIKIEKISNFYETPSYPNQRLPKFLNVGIIVNKNLNLLRLFIRNWAFFFKIGCDHLGSISKIGYKTKFLK